MKINPTTAYLAYNKAAESTYAPRQMGLHFEDAMPKNESVNTDQIQISPQGTRKMEIEQLTKAVSAEYQQATPPEKLESLRNAVQNKAYYVPTGDLAEAMMKHWFLA